MVNSKMEFSVEQICYLNYNQNMTLPEWDIEQERYWQVSIVNSILEYIVYFNVFVKEELCYKNYNQNITFPEWVIEQESNRKVSTVNSILELFVYDTSWMGDIKQERYSFWNILSTFMRLSKKDFAKWTTTKI